MTKKSATTIVLLGLLLMVENVVLKLLFKDFPELPGYLLKTVLLAGTFFFLAHKRYQLKLSFKPQVGILEQLRVNWLGIIYLLLSCLPLIVYGFSENMDMLPTAFLMAIGAGFVEEYIFRGVLLQISFKEGISSYKQVMGTVALTSFLFGLAHITNIVNQSVGITLYQVFYAMCLGAFLAMLTIRTRSLAWAIFMHFMIDFSAILSTATSHSTATVSLVGVLIWLFVLVISVILLRPSQIKKIMTT